MENKNPEQTRSPEPDASMYDSMPAPELIRAMLNNLKEASKVKVAIDTQISNGEEVDREAFLKLDELATEAGHIKDVMEQRKHDGTISGEEEADEMMKAMDEVLGDEEFINMMKSHHADDILNRLKNDHDVVQRKAKKGAVDGYMTDPEVRERFHRRIRELQKAIEDGWTVDWNDPPEKTFSIAVRYFKGAMAMGVSVNEEPVEIIGAVVFRSFKNAMKALSIMSEEFADDGDDNESSDN